jgi:hypothetical protein
MNPSPDDLGELITNIMLTALDTANSILAIKTAPSEHTRRPGAPPNLPRNSKQPHMDLLDEMSHLRKEIKFVHRLSALGHHATCDWERCSGALWIQFVNTQHVDNRKRPSAPPDWLSPLQHKNMDHVTLEEWRTALQYMLQQLGKKAKNISFAALTHIKENALGTKRAMYYENKKTSTP